MSSTIYIYAYEWDKNRLIFSIDRKDDYPLIYLGSAPFTIPEDILPSDEDFMGLVREAEIEDAKKSITRAEIQLSHAEENLKDLLCLPAPTRS